MLSYQGRFEPTRFEDLTVTVDFHCNSACQFCIAAEGMNYFKGVPFELFQAAVDDNVRTRRYRRITFTGGEVALEKSLWSFIDYARNSESFEHIRLQTNGRPMADLEFARRLVEAGVDEYFVSLHGPNAEVQDSTSLREGSFDEAIRGLENLKSLGACVMTNTVMTQLNKAHLRDIVETVKRFEPDSMEFWNYLPMEDYADTKDLLVPVAELAPQLRAALARARELGIETAVKYFPQCLLGEHADRMDNAQPDVVIVEKFYDFYPEFGCVYEAKCEYAESCLGLTHPYISKFGWEEHALVPVPRTTPWREPDYGFNVATHQPGASESSAPGPGPNPDRPPGAAETGDEQDPRRPWRELVRGIPEQHGARLVEMVLSRRMCVYRLALGDEASVDLVLTARDESTQALARSESFNVFYRNALGNDQTGLRALIGSMVQSVLARDPGGMHLDLRKGLVGADSFRRRRSQR